MHMIPYVMPCCEERELQCMHLAGDDLAYDFFQFAYTLVILVVLIGALVQQDQSALMIYFVRVIVSLTIFKELVSATFEGYNSELFLTVDFQSKKCVVRSYSRVDSNIYSIASADMFLSSQQSW